MRPAGRCGSESSLCCRAVSTGAAGPTCQYATVRSSQALRSWGVSALSCNRPEGGGPDISLLCRAIRTGATDLAFERATLQSAVALRIVTTQPYDQPRRNVSEVTLRLSAQAMWVWRFTRLSISVGAGVDCNRAVVPSR